MKVRSTPILAAVGALAIAVVLAACGGSSSTPTNTAAAATGSTPAAGAAAGGAGRTALAACLKKYGVTLPSGGFGGRRFGATGGSGAARRFGATGATGRAGRFFGATGANGRAFPGVGGGLASNPKFAAALAKCGGFGGGFGGRFGAAGATGPRGALVPTSPAQRTEITRYSACMKTNGYDLPKPNFSGSGFVFGTNVKRTSAKFIAANAKCDSLLGSLAGGATGASGASG
jgi:hypothetical protein